jgi:tetratricopeptide (TPR) repeat protein
VTVKLNLPERGGGTTVKTDKKGHWAVGAITSGAWELDFDAPGYAVKKINVNLPSEASRLPPIEVKLDKAVAAGPPPEVRAALEKGDAAFKEGRFGEARAEYEKLAALGLGPEVGATLNRQIAYTYSREGNYAKAVEYLEKVIESDPTNTSLKLIAAQEALRGGMLDKGLAMLKGVDDSSIKEPEVFYNIAALLLNAQKSEEAVTYLTKAVTVDPTYVDGYFQRGLAYLGLQKYAEAKADFNKVIELAPTGPQADTAKKALAQIK